MFRTQESTICYCWNDRQFISLSSKTTMKSNFYGNVRPALHHTVDGMMQWWSEYINKEQQMWTSMSRIREICEISGSHGSEYKDDSFLGCSNAQSQWSRLTFQRCILPTSGQWSPLKCWSTSTRLHGATSQTTVIFINNICAKLFWITHSSKHNRLRDMSIYNVYIMFTK
jgi:hypothetical protein